MTFTEVIITEKGTGYNACQTNSVTGKQDCNLFDKFKTKDGKVADFTIDGAPIAPRLVMGNGDVVTDHGVRFELLSVYLSASDQLIAAFRVESGKRDIM